jgi:hypothetical protein
MIGIVRQKHKKDIANDAASLTAALSVGLFGWHCLADA